MANITIEIIDNSNGTGGGGSSQKSSKKKNTETKYEKIRRQQEERENELASNFVVNQAYNISKQLVVNSVELGINRRVNLQENYILGYQWQNIKSVVSTVGSIAMNTMAGFTVAGPVGAAVAFAGSMVGQAVSIYNKKSEIAQSINTANYNMAFQQTRLSLVNNNRGTEN